MSRSLRLAEDHKFSHPYQATRNGNPVRLSFSDQRQLNKVDKRTQRRLQRINAPDPDYLCDFDGVEVSHSETAKLIAALELDLDKLQNELEHYLSCVLPYYASDEDRRFVNRTKLSELRAARDRALNCLISLS